jgi:hypothetical protein
MTKRLGSLPRFTPAPHRLVSPHAEQSSPFARFASAVGRCIVQAAARERADVIDLAAAAALLHHESPTQVPVDQRGRAELLVKYPKVTVVAHVTNQLVDLVGERYDVAIRAHSGLCPTRRSCSNRCRRRRGSCLGSAYFDVHRMPEAPRDLSQHPSLFMMRSGVAPVWRLRESRDARKKSRRRSRPAWSATT